MFQYTLTESQRDLYSNYSRQERDRQNEHSGAGRVNLNLYGNKFYQGNKEKHQNLWKTEKNCSSEGKQICYQVSVLHKSKSVQSLLTLGWGKTFYNQNIWSFFDRLYNKI